MRKRQADVRHDERMKTTKTHFEYFKQRCRYWAKRFQLGEWEFGIFHESWDKRDRASSYVNRGARIASICLEPEWDGCDVTRVALDNAACHEVLHIALDDLVAYGRAGEHAVIHHVQAALGLT